MAILLTSKVVIVTMVNSGIEEVLKVVIIATNLYKIIVNLGL